MPYRIKKVNGLIKQQIAEIISREVDLTPGVFVTIAKVDTTKDLRYTRVFISIFPQKETDYVLETLSKKAYLIQGRLNKNIYIKPIPRIEFLVDTTEAKADEIEKILKKIDTE